MRDIFMNDNEIFQAIISHQDKVSTANLFILQNSEPYPIKIFPNEVGDVLLNAYFQSLENHRDKEFVEFKPYGATSTQISVIPTKMLKLWPHFQKSRNCINTSIEDIQECDYSDSGNILLMDVEFETDPTFSSSNPPHAFFFTRYRKVVSYFTNAIRPVYFIKINGKFHEDAGNILAINSTIDAVIFEDKCFVLNEGKFNQIFKFNDTLKNFVTDHKQEALTLPFINDGEAFFNHILDSIILQRSFAKAVLNKYFEKISKLSPSVVKAQLTKQKDLSHLKYTADDKLIIDKTSCKTLIKIFVGEIYIDVLTEELQDVSGTTEEDKGNE